MRRSTERFALVEWLTSTTWSTGSAASSREGRASRRPPRRAPLKSAGSTAGHRYRARPDPARLPGRTYEVRTDPAQEPARPKGDFHSRLRPEAPSSQASKLHKACASSVRVGRQSVVAVGGYVVVLLAGLLHRVHVHH